MSRVGRGVLGACLVGGGSGKPIGPLGREGPTEFYLFQNSARRTGRCRVLSTRPKEIRGNPGGTCHAAVSG